MNGKGFRRLLKQGRRAIDWLVVVQMSQVSTDCFSGKVVDTFAGLAIENLLQTTE